MDCVKNIYLRDVGTKGMTFLVPELTEQCNAIVSPPHHIRWVAYTIILVIIDVIFVFLFHINCGKPNIKIRYIFIHTFHRLSSYPNTQTVVFTQSDKRSIRELKESRLGWFTAYLANVFLTKLQGPILPGESRDKINPNYPPWS